MIINNVSVCGFNRLFEGYKNAEKENRKAYGSELSDYLKHSMISIILNELTTIEVFYLKKFCSELVITGKYYRNFTNKEKEPDLDQKVGGILTLHNEILEDSDINKKEAYIDNILPIGCESYSAVAIFKGSSISAITGGFIDDIFKEDGSRKLTDVYIGNDLMSKKISKLFYEEFYRFLYRNSTDIDVVTSYMMDTKFYQYSDNICDLAYINSPYGEISFFANTQDRLQNQISNIKSIQSTCPYYLPDKTYLAFVMNTTFSTFMNLYLNTNYITNYQNLNFVFANKNIDLNRDVLIKYEARISNFINYIISYKNGLASKKEVDLNKLNYIFNGSKILYTLQIPFSEIEKLSNILLDIDELVLLEDKIMNYKKIVENLIG